MGEEIQMSRDISSLVVVEAGVWAWRFRCPRHLQSSGCRGRNEVVDIQVSEDISSSAVVDS